jgi:hypothetical protein
MYVCLCGRCNQIYQILFHQISFSLYLLTCWAEERKSKMKKPKYHSCTQINVDDRFSSIKSDRELVLSAQHRGRIAYQFFDDMPNSFRYVSFLYAMRRRHLFFFRPRTHLANIVIWEWSTKVCFSLCFPWTMDNNPFAYWFTVFCLFDLVSFWQLISIVLLGELKVPALMWARGSIVIISLYAM